MDEFLVWIREQEGIAESEVIDKLASDDARGLRPVRACLSLGVLDESDLAAATDSSKRHLRLDTG